MERVAQYGSVLASWSMHEINGANMSREGLRPPLELPFLQNLQAQTQAMVDNPERMSMRNLLKSLQAQLAMRRLVFTSEGEILNLDASMGEVTARDVALAQGQELSGLERVEVNGRPVPLSSPLHNGDRVVVTKASYGPRTMGPDSSAGNRLLKTFSKVKEVRTIITCGLGY